MNALRIVLTSGILFFLAAMLQHWRTQGQPMALRRIQQASALGVIIGTTWAILDRPFWRGAFLMLSVLAFFSFMLPDEARFLHRHPHLSVALPFSAGFAAANFRRSAIGSLCTLAVLAVLVIASARALSTDPYLGPRLGGLSLRQPCAAYQPFNVRQC